MLNGCEVHLYTIIPSPITITPIEGINNSENMPLIGWLLVNSHKIKFTILIWGF
jgi:hypothetical protein